MIVEALALDGLFLLKPDRRGDARGWFARTYCEAEMQAAGLLPCGRQWSVSYNAAAGTLRGLHFQKEPYPETKLVRCTSGAVFDVAVDLRADSPTRYRWVGVELSRANGHALYIPAGFAHGFQTLVDDTELLYAIMPDYVADLAGGVRWDDPKIAIDWPLPPVALSPRDQQLPLADAA